jgi:predicted NBD/HSP70 family sugar kinase
MGRTTDRARVRLSGTNLERAADHNQRVTLHAIRVYGLLTKVELAAITGLTTPAIANITKRLRTDGLIEEAGRRRGGRGQPPIKLRIRPEACHAIGVNIDRDHITMVVVDFSGKMLARVCEEVDFALPDHVRSLYRRSIEGMLDEAGVEHASLVGIGVALPDELGHIDLPGRPAAYAQWDGIDLKTLFDEPFDLPVFVENDAAAAAMGEMQLGLGQKYPSFFYVLISSGLGGGLVVDGTYWRGAGGRSGEIGFMQAPSTGGKVDQVQKFVSLSGLAGHLRAYDLTLADAIRYDAVSDEAAVCVDDWVKRAAAQLAVPLEAVNCLINPGVVLLGGRLPSVLIEHLAERTHDILRSNAASMPAVAPVMRATLSVDAPAVGAAILPFSHFLLPKPGALWKAPNTSQIVSNPAQAA